MINLLVLFNLINEGHKYPSLRITPQDFFFWDKNLKHFKLNWLKQPVKQL